MNKTIHITTGLTLGIIISSELQLTPPQSLLCVTATSIGSLLPDIDTPYSYLGSRFKLISIPIYKIFGHRTITHSLLTWTILLLASPIFNTGKLSDMTYSNLCVSIYVGILSHLLLDTISTSGVCLLYPLLPVRVHLLPRLRGRNRMNGSMYKPYRNKYHKNIHKSNHKVKHKSKRKKRLPI